MEIKFHKRIRMDSSVMFAGWPGMGGVATDSVNYLRRKLAARFFAEINPSKLYFPEGVLVNKGKVSFPPPPATLFHYRKHPPVTLLEGSAQFRGREADILLKKVLEVAGQTNTEAIITSAAFPVPMNHRDQSEIYFASNSSSFSRDLKEIGLRPLGAGQVSGLNGMLLGYAKARNIDAACVLATIPQYTVGMRNPRAVMEIIDVFSHIIDEDVDLSELEALADRTDSRLDEAEAAADDFLSGAGEEDPPCRSGEKVPGRIIEKIEKLFEEAKCSRQKAVQLKEELDRWDLYPLYEDRFLDLFRENH